MFPKDTQILLVEDMTSIRIWEKKLLSQMGFHSIYEAQHGKDALEILHQQHKKLNPIQIVLCDWRMPELDGLALLKEMKNTAQFQKIPFVMISAESDSGMVLEAMEAGVDHYITKPFTAEKLAQKLELVWKDTQDKWK